MATLELIESQSQAGKPSVIFIHGLGGHASGTWMSDLKDPTSLWPRWLAEDSGCPVWLLGYDAAISAWVGNAMPLLDQGNTVLDLLTNEPRLKAAEIVMVGHSLGGLVIKTSLANASTQGVERFETFARRIKGVVFIATPHFGSQLANLVTLLKPLRSNAQVGNLAAHDSHLRNLNRQFAERQRMLGFKVRAYAETRGVPTPRLLRLIRGPGVTVVDPTSSEPHIPGEVAIPLPEDHLSISKPKDRQQQLYKSLLGFLSEIDKHSSRGNDNRATRVVSEVVGPTGRVELRQVVGDGTRRKTINGSVEEAVYRGRKCLIKRTPVSKVDMTSLGMLAGRSFEHRHSARASESSMRIQVCIAAPLAVWEEGGEVCELLEYHDGDVLYDVVKRNKYRFGGMYLGLIYQSGMRSLKKLHALGLVHRDVVPENMLIKPSGDIVVIDDSFCCAEGEQRVAAWNLLWSPPEQRQLRAVRQSDWYSFAGSIYFLANGEPPNAEGEAFEAGIHNINFGGFVRVGGNFSLFSKLLDDEVGRRPANYEETEVEVATWQIVNNLLGVMSLARNSYLILYAERISMVQSRDLAIEELKRFIESPDVRCSSELEADVRAFIAGGDPWHSV